MTGAEPITLLGLGTMGRELAHRLLTAGIKLTVWNRSVSACDGLRAGGAHVADDADRGLSQSALILVCVTDAAATRDVLLDVAPIKNLLRGRTVAVLSTMNDDEARAMSQDIVSMGAAFLCGTILGYPSNVRDGDCTIAFSGDRDAYQRFESVLGQLGGRAEFLADDPGTTALFDRAVYAAHYGAVVTFIQAATLAREAGLPMNLFVREATAGQLDVSYYADQIKNRNYDNDEAALAVEAAAYADVPKILATHGLDESIAAAIKSLFDRGIAAGFADKGIAALSEALRRPKKGEAS